MEIIAGMRKERQSRGESAKRRSLQEEVTRLTSLSGEVIVKAIHEKILTRISGRLGQEIRKLRCTSIYCGSPVTKTKKEPMFAYRKCKDVRKKQRLLVG